MSKRFEQMVVLITGGGTGIGRVTALAFGAEGANVVIGGLEDDELERTRVELTDNGVDARASRVDVGTHGDVARFVSEAAEAFGHLDVLVNSHAKTDEVEGFVTITGGKGTTLRGMAEVCADMICRKLGVQTECHTREVVLLPHTELYAA